MLVTSVGGGRGRWRVWAENDMLLCIQRQRRLGTNAMREDMIAGVSGRASHYLTIAKCLHKMIILWWGMGPKACLVFDLLLAAGSAQ